MIRTLLHHPGGARIEAGDESLIGCWDPGGEVLLWADFAANDIGQTRELLIRQLRINPLAVSDALRDRHPPKLEWFDDYFFLLVKGFSAETEGLDFGVVHISLFVGRNFLLTVHALKSPSIDSLWPDAVAGSLDFARGPTHLCYRVLRRVVDRYAPVILGLESRLEELEEVIAARPSDEVLLELVSYNSRLKKLRRTFGYQQACFDELRQARSQGFSSDSTHEFQDVYEHMERLTSLSSLMQELARDLMEGYISLNGHRLNQIMKTLTIASVIFLPLTFLAGIYGMNFDNMPELHTRTGYFIVIGAMLAIAGGLLWGFRRWRWI
ncbi:MAG: magnesium/cobalt transporter CorA [Gammaproteobacteria bacterium]|jgi:magnesium transporter|nr:magnesium/cobalt transporter CorA [Gammaproteobacteria bacterium]MBP6053328.1 magnesium/cobalt transporter CorA [Pseudomonadales bacterium]MBK6585116.1 magnesium/cobalt transporter CorA [Gammaproteobacteria bacterium]MBK7168764.1 magnesium/cobalt transporter CorA [Gammaproteobacteria bacterium]MBK7520170.1 magnesium/cobalt transporter CorA [Gammaproteobacteria bacterium]